MRDKFGPNSQQWIYDWIIKTTGRTDHWELSSVPQLPPEVKSWDMIPKVLGKQAARLEKVAEAAAAAGHTRTAWESYLRATSTYFDAQHFITEDDNPKKIALYTRLLACYDKVIEFNEYPIEKVELPFGDTTIPALLHLVPGVKKAPCLLYIRGMDQCKEVFPITMGTVMDNHFHKRGIHLFIIDGPGQGECNLRKIRTRPNNHVEAGKAAVDYLLTRPEVDHDAIGVYGASMGSYWASHIAAADPRISACMVGMLCVMMRRHAIFEEAAPKFRQIFKYMAGIRDDDDSEPADGVKRERERVEVAQLRAAKKVQQRPCFEKVIAQVHAAKLVEPALARQLAQDLMELFDVVGVCPLEVPGQTGQPLGQG